MICISSNAFHSGFVGLTIIDDCCYGFSMHQTHLCRQCGYWPFARTHIDILQRQMFNTILIINQSCPARATLDIFRTNFENINFNLMKIEN